MKQSKQKKVLVIATSRKTMGGITSVVRAHEQCEFWKYFSIYWVETHINGGIIIKLYYAIRSFFHVMFILPFYQLMHIHLSEAPSALRKLPFLLLGKLYGKKVILHFHSFDPQTTINGKWKRLYHFMFSHVDCIVVLSQLWKEWINKYLGISDHISVVYNPCSSVHVVNEQKRNNIILYAGELSSRKGYEDLIRAFANVAEFFPDWKIVFAGNGDIEKGKSIAKDLAISDQVIFLGWVTGCEKECWFEQARIFCLPSYAEGFPTALLDACSYGISFIVTPVGGIPDVIIHEKNGLLFSPGDITALTICLKRLMSDADLRNELGKAAFDLAVTTFSLLETDKQMKCIYNELLYN